MMMMSQDEDHSGVHVSAAECWPPLRDGAVSCSLILLLEVAALCPAMHLQLVTRAGSEPSRILKFFNNGVMFKTLRDDSKIT